MTELDEEMKQMRMIELEYEKGQLYDEVNGNINDFDEEIKDIRQHLKNKEVIKIRKQNLIQQKMKESELDKSKRVEINHEMQEAP